MKGRGRLLGATLLTVWLVAVGVGACSGGGSSDGGNTRPPATPAAAPTGTVLGPATERSIGAAGGTIATPDARLTVTIPPGALTADTTIKIEPVQNTAFGGFGSAYRLSPDGQRFAQPVDVSFAYQDAELEGTHLDLVTIAYQSNDGFWHGYVEPKRDPAGKRVTVSTTHFTDWAARNGARIKPGTANVATNATLALDLEACDAEEEASSNPRTARLAPCRQGVPFSDTGQAWSVNNALGGNAEVGTVSGNLAGATFTAPAQAPSPATVRVSVLVDGLPRPTRVPLSANVTIGGGRRWVGTISADFTGSGPAGDGRLTTRFTANVTFRENPELPSSGFFDCVGDNYTSSYSLTKIDCSTTGQGGGVLGVSGIPAGSLSITDFGGQLQYSAYVSSAGAMDGRTNCNDEKKEVELRGFQPTGAGGTQLFRPIPGNDRRSIVDSFEAPSFPGNVTMTINLRQVD